MKDAILSLFAHNIELTFSQIQKKLAIRSNKLAYYLNKLVRNQILSKESNNYRLAEFVETQIPYFSDKKATLPVILIHIGDKKNAFLSERQKRPYKGLLALPGGRLCAGEDIFAAAKRIMKEKYNLTIIPQKIESISLEHLSKGEKVIHSFLLIVVKATPATKIQLVPLAKASANIIKSDRALIQKSKRTLTIPILYSCE